MSNEENRRSAADVAGQRCPQCGMAGRHIIGGVLTYACGSRDADGTFYESRTCFELIFHSHSTTEN